MKKVVLIILDGLGDKAIEEFGGLTPLESAKTPNMDMMAKEGVTGSMHVIGKGIAPEQDTALFSLFGYDPFKNYCGGGPIEALGAGILTRYGELSLRGNFVTVDRDNRILDIRAGRVSEKDAKELLDALEKIEITNPKTEFILKHTKGHRFIAKFKTKSHNLSPKITSTCQGYFNFGFGLPIYAPLGKGAVKKSEAITNSTGAILAAGIVNQFIQKSQIVLKNHRINRRKKSPANCVVLNDAGNKLSNIPSLNEKYNMSWAAFAEQPLEIGFCKLAGMDIIRTPETLKKAAEKVNEMIEYYDGFYACIRGPDAFGHSNNPSGKRSIIERIDNDFIKNLKPRKDTIICITSNYSTPCRDKVHTDEPVPVLVYGCKKRDRIDVFGESSCKKGKLGIFNGIELMEKITCTLQ